MISPEAVRLIAEHISSVEELEILLLLRRFPEREWTVVQVKDRIKGTLASVATRLEDLQSRGFLCRRNSRYRYDPWPDRESAIASVAEAYEHFPLAVIQLIFSSTAVKVKAGGKSRRN